MCTLMWPQKWEHQRIPHSLKANILINWFEGAFEEQWVRCYKRSRKDGSRLSRGGVGGDFEKNAMVSEKKCFMTSGSTSQIGSNWASER